MAEAIILPVANAILANIVSLTGDDVVEKIKAAKSVNKDLKTVTRDLTAICAVLQDAEAKQYSNATMKLWLDDLKSVVYDIDDLLDEVAFDALKRRVNKGDRLAQMRYYLSSSNPLFSSFGLSSKLKGLRETLEGIVARKDSFGLTKRLDKTPSVERDPFDACAYGNTSAIIGRDEAKRQIMNILSGLGEVSGLSVLPIVGMGGIGKTSLAKLMHLDVDWFDMKLWACVSDKFDLQKILQDIVQDATKENNSNNALGQSVEKLQGLLRGKRYFLVLDDLWEENIILWRGLTSILDVGERGSVILITTRKSSVASITKTIEPYTVDELRTSDCWTIFRKLAFAEGEEQRYPRLCEIGQSLIEKCGGVPLVVRVLESMLRVERDEHEWERVKNVDSRAQLHGQYESVMKILKLNYDKLPSHLKVCFAHLSLFPKDSEYPSRYISYFWRALGLIQLYESHNNIEALGQSFNMGLLSTSMLQDVEFIMGKSIWSYKMHDLMHDLARDIVGEELAVVTMNEVEVSELCRHIAWGHEQSHQLLEFPEPLEKAKKARSFLILFRMNHISQSFLKGMIANMSHLRILHLHGSSFEELPSSIGRLKHLRFLDLSFNILIKTLPDALCELLNLETLCLNGCERLGELPRKIYKLINLRYLSITTNDTSFVSTKLNTLPSIQHLYIESCMVLSSLWDSDDVQCPTSLRYLSIRKCPRLRSLPMSMKLLVELQKFGNNRL